MTPRNLVLALALTGIPGMAAACEHLTTHFELCSDGTPLAEGTWENGGDSATLWVGTVGYEGYEAFRGHEKGGPLRRALIRAVARGAGDGTHHLRDSFDTADLAVVRTIDTTAFKSMAPTLRVLMIAEGGGHRIMLRVEAPADTPVDRIDAASRAFAALVRPKAAAQGN